MSKLVVVFLTVVATTFALTNLSPDEKLTIKSIALPMLDACSQELGISREDILAAKESKNVDSLNPCYFNCFFKKTGFINENGMFDTAVALEKVFKHVKGEETRQEITRVAESCSSVNEQEVGDECERAKLLLNCMIKENHGFITE